MEQNEHRLDYPDGGVRQHGDWEYQLDCLPIARAGINAVQSAVNDGAPGQWPDDCQPAQPTRRGHQNRGAIARRRPRQRLRGNLAAFR